MRLRPVPSGRVSMLILLAITRLAAPISWRAARGPVSRLWFTPQRPAPSAGARARHDRWLAGAAPISLAAVGTKLNGFRAGDGPTVLLVHGWSDRAASLGAFVGPLVDRGFTVVGVDLPGHGDSPGGRTNAFEIASALRDIDRALGGVDAIVAHSIGALVTVLGLRDGLDPRAVGLIAPLVRADNAIDRFATQLRLPGSAVKALRADIEARFGSGVWEELSADLVARGLETPALIVHDENDPETRWSGSKLLAEEWSGARHLTTRGLGHYRVVRDENVVGEITDFIADELFSSTTASRTVGGD